MPVTASTTSLLVFNIRMSTSIAIAIRAIAIRSKRRNSTRLAVVELAGAVSLRTAWRRINHWRGGKPRRGHRLAELKGSILESLGPGVSENGRS